MADWAVTQIQPHGATGLIPALRALRYGNAVERAGGAATLKLAGEASTDAIPLLVRSLADSANLVAESASEALVGLGSRSVPAVEAARMSDNPNVRLRAAFILGRIQPHF
jgi:HEAT repeat protein